MIYMLRRSSPMASFCALVFLIAFPLAVEAQDEGVFTDPIKEYQWRIKQETLSGHYIPKDVVDALRVLERLVDPKAQTKVLALEEEEYVKKLFFGFGKWMMINWGFYEGSRLSHHLKQIGIAHPDDMTTAMMLFYHRTLSGTPLEIESTSEILKQKREDLRNQPAVPALRSGH